MREEATNRTGSRNQTVAVVVTVKNDPCGIAVTLSSLASQTRIPDEIIVVDGGSTDSTRQVIRSYVASLSSLRWVDAPGTNIARGRNVGVTAAESEIIATIDSGCNANPDWLAKLMEPFDTEEAAEFVAGFYQVAGCSLLEKVVGLATMRGQFEDVCPETFNPSARSMALRRDLWQRAGGWPEWIRYSEDTLFDQKIRRMNVGWRFAREAIVRWRPRTSWRAIARQFYHYGTGRGHTQIDAPAHLYNVRNLAAVGAVGLASFWTTWAPAVGFVLVGYFYVWSLHPNACRIVRRTGRVAAYPLYLVVMWVVILSNTAGFLVGSYQRWRDRARYQLRMEMYLTGI